MKWNEIGAMAAALPAGSPTTALIQTSTLNVGAGGAGVEFFLVLRGIANLGATAGNVVLSWAQRASNVVPSIILANSTLTYRKIN
jgi:hypothetical protein